MISAIYELVSARPNMNAEFLDGIAIAGTRKQRTPMASSRPMLSTQVSAFAKRANFGLS